MIDNRYTKAFIKNDRNIVKRSNVINYLINKNNYKKYLEIREKNLHKMNPIPVCKFNES